MADVVGDVTVEKVVQTGGGGGGGGAGGTYDGDMALSEDKFALPVVVGDADNPLLQLLSSEIEIRDKGSGVRHLPMMTSRGWLAPLGIS